MYKGKLLRLIDDEIARRAILIERDRLATLSDDDLIRLRNDTEKEVNKDLWKR